MLLSGSLGTLIFGALSHQGRCLRPLCYKKTQPHGGATRVFWLTVPAKVPANCQINLLNMRVWLMWLTWRCFLMIPACSCKSPPSLSSPIWGCRRWSTYKLSPLTTSKPLTHSVQEHECGFKPLKFGITYYTVMDNHNSYYILNSLLHVHHNILRLLLQYSIYQWRY